MADTDLSQAEVWDDSALLDSWNEAFEEYKKYHSLAAKGEKVRLNLKKPSPDLENGEISTAAELVAKNESSSGVVVDAQVIAEALPAPASANVPTADALPQALLSNVKDDGLKNIMMSWYYAGYYTGLYEGKQQGYTSAMQHRNV